MTNFDTSPFDLCDHLKRLVLSYYPDIWVRQPNGRLSRIRFVDNYLRY